MNTEALYRAGLTKNEIKVYISLLELGDSTSGPLIKKTGVNSSKVYESLNRLEKKGLVSYIKKTNKKFFQAAKPNRLLDYMGEKKRKLNQEKNNIQNLIPSLNLIQKRSKLEQQEAVIYQGIKGYRTILENMLQELSPNGNYFAFASGLLKKELGPYWFIFQKKKKKNKIKSKCIWDQKIKKQKDYLREYSGSGRFISKGSYLSPVDVWVYNDKVIQVSYSSKPIFAVLIKSRGLAQSYKDLFTNIWKSSKS